jgi:hypothetical protein
MAPPKRNTTGVMVRHHEKSLIAIDDLIKKSGEDMSRPEMIRQILKKTLKDQGYDVTEYVE